MRTLTLALFGTALLLTAIGCQNKMAEENKMLWNQNRELQADKASLTAEKESLEARLRTAPDPAMIQTMQQEIAKRNAEIEEMKRAVKPVAGGGREPGMEGLDATYDAKAGTITVNLPSRVLFAPGSEELKSSARTTLNTLIRQIQTKYRGKQVYVDGHTDTDPIIKTKSKWQDNLDLSAGRAMEVARYLTSHGIDSKQVVVRAFGPNKPKATKEASRRVEIVVVVR